MVDGTDAAAEAERLRKLFDEYGQKLSVRSLDDWYKIGKKALSDAGAPAALFNVKHGLRTALIRAYPEHNWEFWRFSRRPWDSIETQRQFLQHLFDDVFKFNSMEDWYSLKASDVVAHGGSGLLQNHGSSLIRALQAAFPEHEWEEWRFVQVPKGFWKDPKNITRFFKWIMTQLEFGDSMEAWYGITPEAIRELGVEKIIERDFGGSIHAALRAGFPTHTWHAWRFANYETPIGFWKDVVNQRAFFEWVSQDLGFKGDLAGFYYTTGSALREKGGVFIHHRYGGNLAAALTASYPDHPWQNMRFVKSSRPEGATPTSQAAKPANFIATAGRELGISSLTQWYSITLLHLRAAGILSEVWDAGGLRPALQKAYPQHCWDSATKSWEVNSNSSLTNLAKQICLDLLSSRNSTALFPSPCYLILCSDSLNPC